MAIFERDKVPGATIDYRFDWSSVLGDDTINSVDWSVSGVTAGATSNTTTTATQRASGGSVGTPATIRCTITTTAGYVYEATLRLTLVTSVEAGSAIKKTPNEVVPVPAPTYTDLGTDTAASYNWAAAAGLTIDSGGSSSTVVISGGTSPNDYALTCTTTFTSGQIDARVRLIQVRDL